MKTSFPPGLKLLERRRGGFAVRVSTTDLSESDGVLVAKRIAASGLRTSEFTRQALLEKARRK